jgi:phage terminase small subunit
MPSQRGSTPKQRAFVREYLCSPNATRAAIKAGYSPATAEQAGSRLLKNVRIRAAIEAAQAKLVERTEITKEWVVREAVETYRQARQLNQIAAARATLDLLARLHGHIVEKRDVRVIRDVSDLSDEELAALEVSLRRKLEGEGRLQ